MVDKVKPVPLKSNRFQKYKGTVTLELTDENGNKEVRKGENTFLADNLSWYLSAKGALNNSQWSASNFVNNPIDVMLGGVLLFDTPIQADENDNYPLFMPAGTKMKACSSTLARNAEDASERGTWNENESSKTADTITYVHDWTTSQGNGTINAISLTSRIGGDMGYGFSTSEYIRSQMNVYSKADQKGVASRQVYPRNNYASAVKDGVLYQMTNSGSSSASTFTLYAYEHQTTEFDLFNPALLTPQATVDYPAGLSGTKNAYGTNDGDFVLGNGDSINSGSSRTFYVFNPKTKASSQVSITNSLSYNVVFKTIINGLWYFQGYASGKYNEFPVYDPTTQTWTEISAPSAVQSSSSNMQVHIPLGENLTLICETGSSGKSIMLDLSNETAYPLGRNTGGNFVVSNGDGEYIETYAGGSSLSDEYGFKIPLYLGTVFNLDSPVTKDASNSMKLTYTLTKVVE